MMLNKKAIELSLSYLVKIILVLVMVVGGIYILVKWIVYLRALYFG